MLHVLKEVGPKNVQCTSKLTFMKAEQTLIYLTFVTVKGDLFLLINIYVCITVIWIAMLECSKQHCLFLYGFLIFTNLNVFCQKINNFILRSDAQQF